jgi:hypothetical protein
VQQVGRFLVICGVVLVVVGLLLQVSKTIPVLGKFGKLPGDIHIKGEQFEFRFPMVTCILISVFLTIVLNLLLR